VKDATVFSADATMAITVNYAEYITVPNGSFEVTNPGDNTWSDGNWMYIPSPWTTSMGPYGRIKYSSAPVGFPALTGGGTWMANMMNSANWVNQNLGTQSFSAGDTISVTFNVGRDSSGSGVLQASFLVGATPYSQTFDTTNQAVNTWQSYTLTQTIPAAVSANLSLKFSNLSGKAGWLDNISNVSVMSVPVPATYASWATTNAVTGGVTGDPNHDGVQNGIAYFMGATGPATNPGIIGNTVTWTNGGNIPSSAYGSQFVVQTSPDLVTWTPVAGTDPKLGNTAGSVSYTLPPGAGKTFVRLVVTPN
jgi:hypothetical protein